MKKIFPLIIVVSSFAFFMIVQMLLVGSRLDASKADKNTQANSAFEQNFSKLELQTTRGTKLKLSEQNQSVIILNFWASWCTPCIKEMESLNRLIEKYSSRKLLVIGINNDDDEAYKKIKMVEKKYRLKFESYFDKNSELTTQFEISAIPASIVFANGKVIHYVNEEFDFMNSEFIQKIDPLLR